jgi:peroxiredoxin Q/BCP
MLNIGDRAPDFTLTDQDGQAVTLAGLLREGDLVLYFYPADFTPVCTREACVFRDHHAALADRGVRVVGVSPQSATSHQRFRETYALPFRLLCDEKKAVIRAFGVDGPLGFGVRRATFLIGRDGTIRNRAVADIFLGDHQALIDAALAGR